MVTSSGLFSGSSGTAPVLSLSAIVVFVCDGELVWSLFYGQSLRRGHVWFKAGKLTFGFGSLLLLRK